MKNKNNQIAILSLIILLLVGNVLAMDDTDESEPEVGLDLNAVAEVFKDSENLGEFEKKLNDPANEINNLDLDENGEVDYLRVEENSADNTRVIAIQSVLGEEETQDVATIAVEKEVNNYNFQIHGTPTIYGANYYVVPRYRNLGAWNLIKWIFRPNYRPYRSSFGWRTYPRYWRVRRPVTYNVYHTRRARFVGKRNFTTSKTVRVKSVKKVRYRANNSKLVKKKKVVKRKSGTKTVVKKKGVKTKTNKKTGTQTRTTVKKKTVKTKKGKKTKVKKVKKKRKKN